MFSHIGKTDANMLSCEFLSMLAMSMVLQETRLRRIEREDLTLASAEVNSSNFKLFCFNRFEFCK